MAFLVSMFPTPIAAPFFFKHKLIIPLEGNVGYVLMFLDFSKQKHLLEEMI